MKKKQTVEGVLRLRPESEKDYEKNFKHILFGSPVGYDLGRMCSAK